MTAVLGAPFSTAWRGEETRSATISQSAAVADPFFPIYKRGDRVMAWMVAAHLVLAACLAPVNSTWYVTAGVGIGAAALYYLCMVFAGGRFITRNVAGLTLMTFCALHIYQMGGMAEMHFFFFTAVTAMIIYQDWRSMWLGVFAIIIQHSIFCYWHNQGVHPGGMKFFEPMHVSLTKLGFHFGIALVQTAFAAWCARIWRLNSERTFALVAANERLQADEDRLERNNGWLTQRASTLEEQLRESQKMDVVGRLAGGVAHDFNNLLTVIQAHAEFAGSDQASDAARKADIDGILQATHSGARLTRQLLTIGRKQVVAPASIDLNEIVTENIEMIRRLAGKDIAITHDVSPDLGHIWADPQQLQQVLLNLVINARDAMPAGGRLRLHTAKVAVGEGTASATEAAIPAGEYVMLTVEDSGTGMTAEVRAHIFEPFFTTKTLGRGTGLGLATVQEVLRQANGHIGVESQPGIGTTFKVFFPVDHAAHAATAALPAKAVRARARALHVLIVQDDAYVRAAFCRALAHEGRICTEAETGAQAVNILLHRGPVDLLITDMAVRGMSGAELVTRARQAHPTLPVLMLSGFSEETASPGWSPPEGVNFVQKPVTPTELIQHVERLVSSCDKGGKS
jgi:two-component system cell cycle sensor histidine kinase/response regulator CckA